MNECILSVRALSKSFPGVKALSQVDLDIAGGEIHGLVGENGAGKSTLVKILSGVFPKDSGRIVFDGHEARSSSPAEALAEGIAVIHQETSLVPTLSVVENVFLGIERPGTLGLIRPSLLAARYEEVSTTLGFKLPPNAIVRDLPVAAQKMTEILKAIAHNARFVIMDEPTDSLSDVEIRHLFDLIREMRTGGRTILYITHYLEEVFEITDRVTVLRDGQCVGSYATSSLSRAEIVRMMIGQNLRAQGNRRNAPHNGTPLLAARGLTRRPFVRSVSFSLHAGEILGITGVIGSGKTELARLLFGADNLERGQIEVRGRTCRVRSPNGAVYMGIGMVPEDRKRSGLVLEHEVYKNLSLAALPRFARLGIIRPGLEMRGAGEMVTRLGIRSAGLSQQAKLLSGGNQQKVVIGRWLLSDCAILIMDEPTRGIDVGSKAEIHRIMRELADRGRAILFISSEVPEIAAVSDRILVMRSGEIVAEYGHGSSQEEITHMMLGGELP